MTTPSEQGSGAGRKFDDIASLFGGIVPPPGSPVRPSPKLQPLPVALPEPTSPPVIPSPPAAPAVVVNEPIAAESEPPAIEAPMPPTMALSPPPPLRVEPPALARPRPTEIPWPDAFEPRPNFKKREPRNWSWLLLIPAGIVAALGISAVDTRALRSWVDTNVLHRSPTAGSIDNSLLPAPFRTQAPSGQTPPAGQAGPGTAAGTAAADAAIPYPALPTSPVPVPPGTIVSPPPVEPAQQAAAAAAAPPIHVTIQYRRNIPGADGEARRIAALLQSTGGSVELRPGAASVRVPTITYYNAADKSSASALALVLANEAASWTLQLGTAKNPPGSLDIWMP